MPILILKKSNRNFSDRLLKPNQDLSYGKKGPQVNKKIATENIFVSYEYGSFVMCNVYLPGVMKTGLANTL